MRWVPYRQLLIQAHNKIVTWVSMQFKNSEDQWSTNINIHEWANGGEGNLNGIVENVPLNCGGVMTQANYMLENMSIWFIIR